jgi:hypothetical protein
MSAIQSDISGIAFTVMLAIICAYSCGRLHQWYRHSLERDEAFREGYSHASYALFPLATRAGADAPPQPVLQRTR